MQPLPDPAASLPEVLGHLILLFRSMPGPTDSSRKALDRLMVRVAQSPAPIEGGILNHWGEGGDPLKERLQVRQVDSIHILPGAPRKEVLALARALADDFAPIPSTDQVRVRLRPELALEAAYPALSAVPTQAALRERPRRDEKLAELVDSVLQETGVAISQHQWRTVLHDIQAVMRMMPGLGEEARRTRALILRRLLSRQVLQALIDEGYRVPEEQPRTAEVVRAGGVRAAELLLEYLRRGDSVGPRGFLVDALGGMPEAFQVVAPLARSTRIFEARLAADLLGRLGVPEAVPILASLVQHMDEQVRLAAVDSLARFHLKSALEPLRQALFHPSAPIRARAAHALAARGSGAIAMPLLAALEAEREPATWEALLGAIAGIDAPEAAAALSRLALEPRGFFRLGANGVRRQLAVVRALGGAGTAAAKRALARIAAEGKGVVAEAAGAALGLNVPSVGY